MCDPVAYGKEIVVFKTGNDRYTGVNVVDNLTMAGANLTTFSRFTDITEGRPNSAMLKKAEKVLKKQRE